MLDGQKYRKKPVVIEAHRFNAVMLHDQEMLADWCGGSLRGTRLPADERVIRIETLEGEMEASYGDWIIKGVKGEFYPCKPDIFEATYEPVLSPAAPEGRQEAVGWLTPYFENSRDGKLVPILISAESNVTPNEDWTPLYTRHAEQAVTEAQPDPIELVREKIESLSKGKDAAEYVIATMATNLKAGNVTTSQLLEWFESEGRAALKAAMEAIHVKDV